MNFCPECGSKLKDNIIENHKIRECQCGFIDWDNWVNIACVVVGFNDNKEFMMVSLKGDEQGKITFPGGYRNLQETVIAAAKREFFEETGYKINNLKLFNVYTRDELRLVWIVFTANIKEGIFRENPETEKILFFSKTSLPNKSDLRGNLTSELLQDILLLY